MRIAILQPTFLPWLGWFDIADQVDMVIILDDVAFSKQSWQQRNRLRTPRGLEVVTVPVRTAGRLGQTINEVEIAASRFAVKLERTIVGNYARSPYFENYFSEFQKILRISSEAGKLARLNMQFIQWLFEVLGISTPYCFSKDMAVTGKRGEYVASLCQLIGASDYLSPLGAKNYLIEDYAAFDQRGIKVWLHEYIHPEYRQCFSPFIPYASTLDLLFNEGQRSLDIIRSGRRQPIRWML